MPIVHDYTRIDVEYAAIARAKLGIDTIVGPEGPRGPAGKDGKKGDPGPPGTFDPAQFAALFAAEFSIAFPLAFQNALSALVTSIDGNGDNDDDVLDFDSDDYTTTLDCNGL